MIDFVTKGLGGISISSNNVIVSYLYNFVHYSFHYSSISIKCEYPDIVKKLLHMDDWLTIINDPELQELRDRNEYKVEYALRQHYCCEYFTFRKNNYAYTIHKLNFCPRNIDEKLKQCDDCTRESIIVHQLVDHLMSPITTTKSARR